MSNFFNNKFFFFSCFLKTISGIEMEQISNNVHKNSLSIDNKFMNQQRAISFNQKKNRLKTFSFYTLKRKQKEEEKKE